MQKQYIWHPNTQMKEWSNFRIIKSGNGMWLIDSNGNKLLDGVASMWCNVWGHSKKELINTIIKQSKDLQHSSLFNLTHEPAEKLAKKLAQISPHMYKVFYSDNGSTSIEVALKIALQYWQNVGKSKNKFISLENGYHGDTFGSMSVGYMDEFFSKFKTNLFSVIQIPVPIKSKLPTKYTFDEYQKHCLNMLESKLANDKKIAAMIMESGAQIAGGVNIYPDKFQQKISKLCRKYEVLLIVDEVATGFGRLGSLVEYQSQKSKPDIVCYGKMLTGGYMTLAATLTTKKIYDSFNEKFYNMKHFFHGHTFTGNPIATSVAYKNLELYGKYNLIKKIENKSKLLKKRYDEIISLDMVKDVRTKGLVMGIELQIDRTKKSLNKIIFEEAANNNIYLRTLGNVVMLVPPLAISKNELTFLIDKTIKTIQNVSKNLKHNHNKF